MPLARCPQSWCLLSPAHARLYPESTEPWGGGPNYPSSSLLEDQSARREWRGKSWRRPSHNTHPHTVASSLFGSPTSLQLDSRQLPPQYTWTNGMLMPTFMKVLESWVCLSTKRNGPSVGSARRERLQRGSCFRGWNALMETVGRSFEPRYKEARKALPSCFNGSME